MFFTRRFLPYFLTQCLGALNDNVYKNVLLLMVTYSQVSHLPITVPLFVNLAAGLFILPFFLFSAHAGLIADSMDKARLIRWLKWLEVGIMLFAAFAIIEQNYLLMLVLLFLMGTQSAYFGPVKYSLLPYVLKTHELTKGNSLVEMGTFLSILAGTLWAGIIVTLANSSYWAAGFVCFFAATGLLTSQFIPSIPVVNTVKKPKFAPLAGTFKTLDKAYQQVDIWIAVLAISWFWFVGATYLTQFPNFAKLSLHADATVVSLLLMLFSIGIGMGSLLCARLSFGRVELALVPIGLFGLAVFGIDLYWSIPTPQVETDFVDWMVFVQQKQYFIVMLDVFMVGVCGGLYIVPLYTFIQANAKQGECAQAIAANNIMNALFMVVAAICAMLVLGPLGGSVLGLFLLLSLASFFVLLLLLWRWPAVRFAVPTYVKALMRRE